MNIGNLFKGKSTINNLKKDTDKIKGSELISLLPRYESPQTLLVSDIYPCDEKTIIREPVSKVTEELKRSVWVEGLYVKKNELEQVKRYKNSKGNYKNDFSKSEFFEWIIAIENNMVISNMQNKSIGKGVFVPQGKTLAKGTFIPSSGIIKLKPTEQELATKVHCSALEDFNTPNKHIYGLIDPAHTGGVLDLINHAPDKNELENFDFKKALTKKNVLTSNLKSTIKFYCGYAIMGLEAVEDIHGGAEGLQLLWSYARSSEYVEQTDSVLPPPALFLFDNRAGHQGRILDVCDYGLRKIKIFIDNGESKIQKMTTLTRWEIMEASADSQFLIVGDPNALNANTSKELIIYKSFLQSHLKKNLTADRIILLLQSNEN